MTLDGLLQACVRLRDGCGDSTENSDIIRLISQPPRLLLKCDPSYSPMDRQLHIPPSCSPPPHSIVLHSMTSSACCHALLRSTSLDFTFHLFRGRHPHYGIATTDDLYRCKVGLPLFLCQPPPCRLPAVARTWADSAQQPKSRHGFSSVYACSVAPTRRPAVIANPPYLLLYLNWRIIVDEHAPPIHPTWMTSFPTDSLVSIVGQPLRRRRLSLLAEL